MSLLLPTWQSRLEPTEEPATQLEQRLPVELVRQDRMTKAFTARAHWELSTTLTSNHLLAVVALANTLMSMNNATFVPEQERNRKMHRPGNRGAVAAAAAGVNWNKAEEENEEIFTVQQAQIKQGWSLLATLHCVLLPDKVAAQGGSKTFKRPQVEMMARRWQHQCLEVKNQLQVFFFYFFWVSQTLQYFNPSRIIFFRKSCFSKLFILKQKKFNDYSNLKTLKKMESIREFFHIVFFPNTPYISDFWRLRKEESLRKCRTNICFLPGKVREAAQALLLAELGRMGPKGRKSLVDNWSQYLPMYSTQEPIAPQAQNHSPPSASPVPPSSGEAPVGGAPEDEDEEEELAEEMSITRKPSSVAELKRKQNTAVVLLGVIGAEFGQDVATTTTLGNSSSSANTNRPDRRENEPQQQQLQQQQQQRRKSSVAEGFAIGNNNLARHTSMALTHLLHAPHSPKLPMHTSLRRAAIDLIGRGFTVWEPYLDVSKVLLGLLEMCCDADKLVPSMTYGLPLTPQADSCRTARHALTLIATARPAAFITTMAREVARFNTLQQNAQTLNVNLGASVLARAKPEILRIVEQLIDKMQSEMSDLLVEVTFLFSVFSLQREISRGKC